MEDHDKILEDLLKIAPTFKQVELLQALIQDIKDFEDRRVNLAYEKLWDSWKKCKHRPYQNLEFYSTLDLPPILKRIMKKTVQHHIDHKKSWLCEDRSDDLCVDQLARWSLKLDQPEAFFSRKVTKDLCDATLIMLFEPFHLFISKCEPYLKRPHRKNWQIFKQMFKQHNKRLHTLKEDTFSTLLDNLKGDLRTVLGQTTFGDLRSQLHGMTSDPDHFLKLLYTLEGIVKSSGGVMDPDIDVYVTQHLKSWDVEDKKLTRNFSSPLVEKYATVLEIKSKTIGKKLLDDTFVHVFEKVYMDYQSLEVPKKHSGFKAKHLVIALPAHKLQDFLPTLEDWVTQSPLVEKVTLWIPVGSKKSEGKGFVLPRNVEFKVEHQSKVFWKPS
jgi:hypothetical protein